MRQITSQIYEIDYFYLDMNGIIYKFVMDDSALFKSLIKTRKFDEIFISVFNYINLLVSLIKPKKLLFLAFDGKLTKI